MSALRTFRPGSLQRCLRARQDGLIVLVPGLAGGGWIPHWQLADPVHLNTPSLKRLDRCLANLALVDMSTSSPVTVKRGPRPQAVHVEDAQNDLLTLTFSGVNGSLVASGRLDGFRCATAMGPILFAIYTATLDAKRPDTVLLKIKPKVVAPGTKLWYGWGNNPHCNLSDAQDLGPPVFALSLGAE